MTGESAPPSLGSGRRRGSRSVTRHRINPSGRTTNTSPVRAPRTWAIVRSESSTTVRSLPDRMVDPGEATTTARTCSVGSASASCSALATTMSAAEGSSSNLRNANPVPRTVFSDDSSTPAAVLTDTLRSSSGSPGRAPVMSGSTGHVRGDACACVALDWRGFTRWENSEHSVDNASTASRVARNP